MVDLILKTIRSYSAGLFSANFLCDFYQNRHSTKRLCSEYYIGARRHQLSPDRRSTFEVNFARNFRWKSGKTNWEKIDRKWSGRRKKAQWKRCSTPIQSSRCPRLGSDKVSGARLSKENSGKEAKIHENFRPWYKIIAPWKRLLTNFKNGNYISRMPVATPL